MSAPDPAFRASIDDPAWVLARYREAKEIIDELQCFSLPPDLNEMVAEWETATAFDACTTCGSDCGCNTPR